MGESDRELVGRAYARVCDHRARGELNARLLAIDSVPDWSEGAVIAQMRHVCGDLFRLARLCLEATALLPGRSPPDGFPQFRCLVPKGLPPALGQWCGAVVCLPNVAGRPQVERRGRGRLA